MRDSHCLAAGTAILCITKHGADMTDLDRALAEIGAIRSQLARGERFHGLGPTAFASTGVLAILAAFGQARWMPAPGIIPFLTLWIAVAAVSAGVIGLEMI